MEPNEVQELHEQHEHAEGGHEKHDGEPSGGSMKPVSFSMSVIAVLVAIFTVLGHRTHTEAVLEQARASDQWNYYQAKRIRQNETLLAQDVLTVAAVHDPAAAAKLVADYKDRAAKLGNDLDEEQAKAREFEQGVVQAEHKASRYDLAEALLEIGLVVTSITLLTRLRMYWLLGMGFAVAGMLVAVSGVLVH